ncbi:MAG: FtsX-like permease family protein, partial [Bifidobacteriaceae bacterium]|nr:FtsX-like permease family protein [Bifidobacteriaceae bacterium]
MAGRGVSIGGGTDRGRVRSGPVLRPGVSGGDVAQLQEALGRLGLYSGAGDGVFDEGAGTDEDTLLAADGGAGTGAGTASSTSLAVMERIGEIGLRQALGAKPSHILSQFLLESIMLGGIGGLLGSAVGIAAVLIGSVLQSWSPALVRGRVSGLG